MRTLQELLARWELGTLNPEEVSELKGHLARPEQRAELVQEWLLTESICHTLSTQAAEVPSVETVPSLAQDRSARRRRGLISRWLVWREFQIPLRWVLGGACALCLVLTALYIRIQSGPVAEWVQSGPGVSLLRDGRALEVRPGQALFARDVIQVGPDSVASLGWNQGGTHLELKAGSALEIAKSRFGGRILLLQNGTIQASVAPQGRWQPLTIQTPDARARVVGTRFTISTKPGSTRLDVLEGTVRLTKTLEAEHAEILVEAGQTALVAAGIRLQSGPLTGFLSNETWLVPAGTALSQSAAMGRQIPMPLTEMPPGQSNQVQRLRGYLSPPLDGSYTFWLAAFDPNMDADLWLSTDESPARKRRVAFVEKSGNVSGARARPNANSIPWNRSPTQRSAAVNLSAGKRYYLEVWYEGTRMDYVAIGWQRPGDAVGTAPVMIDVNALSPFVSKTRGLRSGEEK
jgi:hypothetical protein